MDSELEVIRTEMEATRGSLAEKLGFLETQVRDTVAEAGEAVSATKEGVMDVVSSVSDTVTSVKDSIKETFNISKQVEAHPWGAFGAAIAAGAVGAFLTSSKKPVSGLAAGLAPMSPTPTPRVPGLTPEPPKAEPGIFDSMFSKLQALAVTSLVDVVQDMVQQSAPEPWKASLKDIVKDISSQLTGEKKSGY